MKQILVDPARQAELIGRGFTTVPLFSADEVATLLDAFSRLRPDDRSSARAGKPASGYHTTILDSDFDKKRGANAIISGLARRHIDEILVGYRVVTSGFLVKEPAGGPLNLHRDWTMTERVDDIGLNIWSPLIDVDEDNGALRFLPGSHRLVPNIEGPNLPFYFQGYGPDLGEHSVLVPLKAGEAVIFDTTILHGSSTNASDRVRPAVASFCVPQDSRVVLHRLDMASGAIERFDMEDDAYVEHGGDDFYGGAIRRPRLAPVTNRNRKVSRPEFDALLAKGDMIRRRFYAERPTLAGWLRSAFDRASPS
ncbi:MAG: hypothetical protein JWN66_2422 [Sphingomonas bacterium]|uniref:phytanoyl-CoA dioxygenase family protein n=1 Tax=Sphingomonas bacterium TaxID=1895847 RepID=UPI00262612F5|nr:phytanoyl-CoA dioxygenase family protein [Sphingomonas bacterium]MDB5705306.1 hypothetical protein [Sphingomonas bacterium]